MTILFYLTFKALPKLKWIEKIQDPMYRKWTKQAFWVLSISRNALVVLASATLAYFLSESKEVIIHKFLIVNNFNDCSKNHDSAYCLMISKTHKTHFFEILYL